MGQYVQESQLFGTFARIIEEPYLQNERIDTVRIPWARLALTIVPIACLVFIVVAPAQATPRCGPSADAPDGAVVPEPFLELPFRAQDGRRSLTVSNGWITASDEEQFTGPGIHAALDFEFSRQPDHGYGLPVLAAADGRAYYTYQNLTDFWRDDQGVSHRIGLGGGLVVEVRHHNGFVTQYIHLATIAPGIPYLRPEPDPDVPGDWIPTGLFQSNEVLWELGVPVRQGQIIGTQGDTGIGLEPQARP